AGAVRAEQTVDLSVPNVEAEIVDRSKLAEVSGQVLRADRDLAAQGLVSLRRRERYLLHVLAERAEPRDERVLEERLVSPNVVDRHARRLELLDKTQLRLRALVHEHVEPVAKALHVDDVGTGAEIA